MLIGGEGFRRLIVRVVALSPFENVDTCIELDEPLTR